MVVIGIIGKFIACCIGCYLTGAVIGIGWSVYDHWKNGIK